MLLQELVALGGQGAVTEGLDEVGATDETGENCALGAADATSEGLVARKPAIVTVPQRANRPAHGQDRVNRYPPGFGCDGHHAYLCRSRRYWRTRGGWRTRGDWRYRRLLHEQRRQGLLRGPLNQQVEPPFVGQFAGRPSRRRGGLRRRRLLQGAETTRD